MTCPITGISFSLLISSSLQIGFSVTKDCCRRKAQNNTTFQSFPDSFVQRQRTSSIPCSFHPFLDPDKLKPKTMKNIAICYSEHAIKVSDSYCSGPSNQIASISPLSTATSTQNTATTSIYRVKLSNEKHFLVRVSWCNSPSNQAFSVGVSDYPFSATKLSRNFKILRRQRGSESFESGGVRADVFWDLRRARYEAGPEPVAGFYVAVMVNSELSLMLGDMEQELEVKNCISDVRAAEHSLISRGERFSGDGVYSTRAKFSEAGTWHDILIKFSGEGGTTTSSKNPYMSVYVDKKSVIEVKRLQWNFRGNESIFLDAGLLIDLMWDVHDWLFNPTSGYAVFLFRTRRGLDSRLWLEDTNFHHQKLAFSFLIFASKNPD